VRYWVIPITYDNWLVCDSEGIYGFGRSLGNIIKINDVIIFYVKKKECRVSDYAACFVGAYKVISDWFKGREPLWPDEREAGRVLYPYRVRLRLIKDGKVKVEGLVDGLSFIKNKERWQVYFRGCPANFRRPIPEEDARLIIEKLR